MLKVEDDAGVVAAFSGICTLVPTSLALPLVFQCRQCGKIWLMHVYPPLLHVVDSVPMQQD